MKIEVKLFGHFAEDCQTKVVELNLPEKQWTMEQLFKDYILPLNFKKLQLLYDNKRFFVACNHTIANLEDSVSAGDIIAFFPKVSGG